MSSTTQRASSTTSRRRKATMKSETTAASVDPTPGQSSSSENAHPQYPQLQFVHVPYSYLVPAVSPAPVIQPHPQTPVQPQQAVAIPSQTQPPSLESVFQDTVHKFRDLEMSLAGVQAATKRAMIRQQHEQHKLRVHCMAFKQERDAARRQVMFLLQERSQLLRQRRHSAPALSISPPPPPTTATSVGFESAVDKSESSPTEYSIEHRKAARNARRHSPYSAGPSRRSSSPSNAESPSSPICFPPPRPSSTPPTLSRPTTFSASTAPSPMVEEGLQFAICDPLRKAGDSTSFEVSYNARPESIIFERAQSGSARQVQIKGKEPAILLRQAHYVETHFPTPSVKEEAVDGELDMDLGSDDEDGMTLDKTRGMEVEDVSAAEPSIDIQHLDLLYTPARGNVWCRSCMFRYRRSIPLGGPIPESARFETTSDWDQLRDHAISAHPDQCDRVARLQPEDLSRLRAAQLSSYASAAAR
ncbi:hypothetical protein EST38_g7469 [Candolleomyces aberdarensis]|uniref:Uncharacterized protein n=1 Tax=Candolleomyces aberdarensis TaxID=2316362 RepID=A0A4Q2DHA3_9AGAR|nr:hypothetical protein EST38_g7469 [Candolleomyces aberdarensis]